MKKHLGKLLLAPVLLISLFFSNFQAHASTNINVTINGQVLYSDQPPILENGRVLVPMRTIFEVVGAEVEWNPKTQAVKATKGSTVIVLPLNSNQATINERKNSLDVPAVSINGRTLVPLRFVSEALGCQVEWKSAQSLVLINYNEGEIIIPASTQSENQEKRLPIPVSDVKDAKEVPLGKSRVFDDFLDK